MIKKEIVDIDTSTDEGKLLIAAIRKLAFSSNKTESRVFSMLKQFSNLLYSYPINMKNDILDDFRKELEDPDYLYMWQERLSQAFIYAFHEWRESNTSHYPKKDDIINISHAAAGEFLRNL